MDKKEKTNMVYPIVIAHRGGGKIYGDNTLKSIQHSISIGVTYIEIDVRKTKDNVIILYHNSWIQYKHDIIYIHDMTYEDIYNIKDNICRLDEVLKYISTQQYTDICINIDIKEEGMIDDINKIIYEYTQNKHVNFVYTSFLHTEILNIRHKYDNVQYGMIFDIYDIELDTRDDINIIILNIDSIDSRTIDKIKQKQKQVWLYTVNTETDIKLALDLHVDGIITDVPDLFIGFV